MQVYVSRVSGVPGIPGSAYPASSIRPLYPDAPEPEAYEQWQLGGDSASLVGRKRGLALSTTGTAPSYFSNYLVVPEGAGNGLRSTIQDAQEQTICAVVRWDALPSGSGGLVFGTSQAGGGDGTGFALQRTSAGPVNSLVRPNTASQSFGSAAIAAIAGKWVFVCLAMSRSGLVRRAYISGIGPASGATAQAYSPSARGIALGNAYYADNNYRAGVTASSFFVIARSVEENEFPTLLSRAVAREAARGIEIYTG